MALLLNTSRLGTALRRPGPSRLRKLAPPAKLVIPWIAAPSLPRAAAVSVEAPTAACPTNAAGGKRPTLYLLHRHLPRSTDTNEGIVISQEQLHQLHDDLKAMEKVAKRAAWFTTVEAGDGEHVLLLTDCEKMGRKYGLQAMPADASSFTLDLPGRIVSLPLEEVSAALLAQKGMESSSDKDEASGSDDDDVCPQQDVGTSQVGAVAKDYNKKMEKAAKKQRKEEEKAAKALAKLQEKSKDEDNSEDESMDEDDKEVTKAKKKDKEEEGEKKKKNKKDKEEKKEKEVIISSKVEDDSDEEDSSSGSGSDEEMATMDARGMEVVNKMEDGSDNESDNENGSESSEEEATMSPVDTMEVRANAAPQAMDVEECQSMDEESSGSESEESGSESSEEEEMEVKAIDVVKAVETGEITPLEA